MLIEFRVKNFRCLRDEQVLSMVPTKDKDLRETHTSETGFKSVPELLNSAVIYGANASGKSTVLEALLEMKAIVRFSAKFDPEDEFACTPFLLDSDFSSQPTEFEVSFIVENVRYRYGFACNKTRVLHEYLYVYKTVSPRCWFTRDFNEETGEDDYYFGPSLTGQKNLLKKSTRPNSLFASMAIQLNNQQLLVVRDWFVKQLLIIHTVQGSERFPILPELKESEEKRKSVCGFLQSADISIDSIEIEDREIPSEIKDFLKEKEGIDPEKLKNFEVIFHHKTEKGNAVFELEVESQGTKALFFLLGPIFNILESKGSIFVDELDNSLHTLLVKKIIYLFHTQETSSNNAQLIFTTHDTSLMQDRSLFRRDQIWFVEKDADQASSLYSLAEFSPRKNEAIEKGYLQGRYGAIPLLSDWTDEL